MTRCAYEIQNCDVVIDTEYQHNGLGTALVSYIESLPEYAGFRGILITRDAHSLYKKFGYGVWLRGMLSGREWGSRPGMI